MNLFDNIYFLFLFFSSPAWLFRLGRYFQKNNNGYGWQTIANGIFFLSIALFVVDASLLIGKVTMWNLLFHNPYTLIVWIPLLATPFVTFWIGNRNGNSASLWWLFVVWFALQVLTIVGYGLNLLFRWVVLQPLDIILQSFPK